MMRCPHCQSQDFTIGRTVHALVRIWCTDDGDYVEKDEDVRGCDWHTVLCNNCDTYLEEGEARDCFDLYVNHSRQPLRSGLAGACS